MTTRQKLQLLLDLAMTILLLPLMAYSLVGELAHEWLGLAMCVLFLGHHALNLHWYKGLTTGRWSLSRIFQAGVNFALLFMMLGLMVSGVILSRQVFSFLPISGGTAYTVFPGLYGRDGIICSNWLLCGQTVPAAGQKAKKRGNTRVSRKRS